jgi:hypothetical protein
MPIVEMKSILKMVVVSRSHGKKYQQQGAEQFLAMRVYGESHPELS